MYSQSELPLTRKFKVKTFLFYFENSYNEFLFYIIFRFADNHIILLACQVLE